MAEEQGKDEKAEGEKLHRALRDAQPAWLRDGQGIRGPHALARLPSPDVHRRSDHPRGSVVRQPVPVTETATTTAEEQAAAASVPDIAFYLSDATEGDTAKVFVADGKVDGTFPDGMGGGDYVLTPGDPADAIIYVHATFNPETLELTSRSLGISAAADFPDSRVDEEGGFLYWQLGFTFLDGDTFRVVVTRTGDIHVELLYGAYNGKPALWAGAEIGWLDLESLLPL